MAIQKWCRLCNMSIEKCADSGAHRSKWGFRADVRVSGERHRSVFDTLAEAKDWQTKTKAGPSGEGETLSVEAALDMYWAKHCLVHMKRPERSELYRHNNLRKFFHGTIKRALTLAMSDDYIQQRLAGGTDIDTVNREINTLKGLSRWLTERGFLTANPLTGLKHVKGDTRRIRWLSDTEINLLADNASERMRQMVLFALNTGFRKENVENVKVEDVHFADGFITAAKTKSGKPYEVPIFPSYKATLEGIIAGRKSGPIFPHFNFGKEFLAMVKAAGLYTNSKDPNRVTIHVLRHTYAAHLLRTGKSIYAVSKWLGHSSVVVTEQVYGHLCKEFQKEHVSDVEIGGHLMVTTVIPFSPKVFGPNGIRTRDLCLERAADDDNSVKWPH
jgi:integrase